MASPLETTHGPTIGAWVLFRLKDTSRWHKGQVRDIYANGELIEINRGVVWGDDIFSLADIEWRPL